MNTLMLRPSSAHRWMRCTASVDFCKDLPDTTSRAAEDGTWAHEIARNYLLGLDPGSFPDEWAEPILDYVNYVRKVSEVCENEWLEHNFSIVDGLRGTVDWAGADYKGDLHVVDFKFGQGVRVDVGTEAEPNEQLMCYALGAFKVAPRKAKTFVLHIAQPRMNNYQSLALPISALHLFESRLVNTMAAIEAGDVSYNPGEKQCHFCPGRAQCKTRRDYVLNRDFMGAMENGLTDADTAKLFGQVAAIKKFCSDIEGRALQLANKKSLPGYKIVAGRGTSAWTEDASIALEKELGENAFTKKTISITDAKKVLPKNHEIFTTCVVKKSGAPNVVPEDDPRPALDNSAQSDFENL